ncbi:MAG: M56 family metallopeptidase [Bacteroidales bacterium]|nr:M56 family metallopeptidase [Bacteroidales bacterium]
MMESLLNWNMRAALYLLLFSIAYLLLLRRNASAGFNRFYLLLTSVLALVLPLISLTVFQVHNDAVYAAFQLPEILVNNLGASDTVVAESTGFSLRIFSVFALVSLFFLLLYVSRLLYILVLIFGHQKEKHAEMTLVKLQNDKVPFSFFHWLFVSDALKSDRRFEAVLAHEKAHSKRLHSLDVLFIELLQIVFWFHPAWYFMRAELKAMHEYEADAIAIAAVNKTTYQRSLLELTTFGGMLWLTNPFNVSLIKKRLLMMNRKNGNQPSQKWLKLLMVLPFLAAAIFIQSCNFGTDKTEEITVKEVETARENLPEPETPEVPQEPEAEIFTVVEEMPVYPGGASEMMNFLANNIQYPEQARRQKIQGRVFVNFVVEKDGAVSNVKILRGIGSGCDEEAIRVVELMPKWKPGKQRGQAVRVSFNLPVKFVLE